MANDETSILIVVVIAVVSLAGIALAATAFSTNHSFGGMMRTGGGMMDQNRTVTDTGPGILEWSVLIISAAFLAVAVVLWWGSRTARRPLPAMPASKSLGETAVPPGAVPSATAPAARTAEPLAESALVKLLDSDERQMYLELREHGGMMLQRDLVALGIWSKAKVTRVLDKLEAKGVVVREAHGMTNRIRIVQAAK